MSKSDLLTVAALNLGLVAVFTPQQLTVKAWEMFPLKFGIPGYRGHADTHAVRVLLSCRGGPVKEGLIARVAPGRYKLTDAGAITASRNYRLLKEAA